MQPVTIRTVCQSCGASIETEYVRLGAVEECRECLSYTVTQVPIGEQYPNRRDEMRLTDFNQLLKFEPYRQDIAPLMAEWFGYGIAETPAGVLLVNPAGEALDTLWVHLRIQADGDRRQTLYQRAMSLWR